MFWHLWASWIDTPWVQRQRLVYMSIVVVSLIVAAPIHHSTLAWRSCIQSAGFIAIVASSCTRSHETLCEIDDLRGLGDLGDEVTHHGTHFVSFLLSSLMIKSWPWAEGYYSSCIYLAMLHTYISTMYYIGSTGTCVQLWFSTAVGVGPPCKIV